MDSLNVLLNTLTPEKSKEGYIIKASINNLRNDTSIHILKADKGRSTVLWSSADYDKEALRQLQDKSTYLQMSKEIFTQKLILLTNQVHNYADYLKGNSYITTRELDALLATTPSLGSAFYLLPKIHKKPNPFGGFLGRPIVATFTNPVHLLDKYLTALTAPLLPLIPGSLKDTPDLINKLKASFNPPLTKKAVIVTADVNSLYPSIPWNEGIDASVLFYREHYSYLQQYASQNNLLPPPPVSMFADLLRFVLENSYIHLKNQSFYKQLSGTAMGMCISVFFANAYMYQVTHKHIHNPESRIRMFLRFIDDILIIFDEATDTDVARFFQTISNEHIEYTIDNVGISQNFLDLTISINQTTYCIDYAPYCKPTSSGSYIHPASCHPRHVIQGIPYSQFLRLRRNSSSDAIYWKAATKLTRDFRRSGYPKLLIKTARNKAFDPHTRKETVKPTSNERRFFTPFNSSVNYEDARFALTKVHEAILEHYEETPEHLPILSKLQSRPPTITHSVLPCIGVKFTRLIKQGQKQ